MHHLHFKKFLELFFTLLVILILFLIGRQIGYQPIIDFMKANEALGIFIYLIYAIVSTVIIPLPLVPIWPVALFLYGFWPSLLVTLTGTLVGSSISFFLARKFGKKLVIKMMGKHLFNEVEHLAHVDSPKTFFLIRAFGNNYYDTINYIGGLSKLSFTAYISISFVATSFWTLLLFYLIQRAGGLENIKTFLTLMTGYAVIVLVGTLIWEAYHKLRLKKIRRQRH